MKEQWDEGQIIGMQTTHVLMMDERGHNQPKHVHGRGLIYKLLQPCQLVLNPGNQHTWISLDLQKDTSSLFCDKGSMWI